MPKPCFAMPCLPACLPAIPCHAIPSRETRNGTNYTLHVKNSSRILADQLLFALFGFIWAHCELCKSIHFLCFETNTKKREEEEEEIAHDRRRNTICFSGRKL